jgi:hypothetical protein
VNIDDDDDDDDFDSPPSPSSFSIVLRRHFHTYILHFTRKEQWHTLVLDIIDLFF